MPQSKSASGKTAKISNEKKAPFVNKVRDSKQEKSPLEKSNISNCMIKNISKKDSKGKKDLKRDMHSMKTKKNSSVISKKNNRNIVKIDKIKLDAFFKSVSNNIKNIQHKINSYELLNKSSKTTKKLVDDISRKSKNGLKLIKSFVIEDTYRYYEGVKTLIKRRNSERQLKIKIYSTLILLFAVLVILTNISNKYNIGYINKPIAILVGGEQVGIVRDKEQAKDILYQIYGDVYNKFNTSSYKLQNPIEFKEVQGNYNISNSKELKNKIIEKGKLLIKRHVLTIDGKAYFAFDNPDIPKKILDDLKTLYYKDKKNSARFLEKVEIKEAYISPDVKLMDAGYVFDKIRFGKDKVLEYEIKEGDTLWDIANKNDLSVDDIFASNPGLTENIKPGQKVKLVKAAPMINVVLEKQITYEETMPREVKVVKVDNMYKTQSKIQKEGADGKAIIKANIVYLNGLEYDRKVISQQIIKKPSERIVLVGTKEPPKYFATGRFSYPVWGMLTSRYGYRGREFHQGIDLAVPWGSSVRAADGGVVEFTGWSGGYGKLVVINHRNGYKTYYGHLSRILVKVGQKVIKGDVIARSGSTGRSTGPHLHFEVRKNGVPQNPLRYLR